MYLVIEQEKPIKIINCRQMLEWQSGGFLERTEFSFPVSEFTTENINILKNYFNGYQNAETEKKYTFSVYDKNDTLMYDLKTGGFLRLEFEAMEDNTRPSESYFTGTIFGLCPTGDN